MCGIFAVIAPKGYSKCSYADWAVQRLHHRGPDAQGTCQIDLPFASITLGMSRLKIVDQADLVVPYDFRVNLGVVLAFNGEVYDWRERRSELHSEPHGGWLTRCDAEVIAAAWRCWGTDCLHHLNGMWGLVLVDTWEPQVFVARDRAGEKPLYHAERRENEGKIVYYASEIKALPVELKRAPCLDAQTLEFDCGAHTSFEGVSAQEPGTWTRYREGDRVEQCCWWALPDYTEETSESYVDDLTALLTNAIKIRHVAEVPMAIQLSGGLDSAIVQAVCQHERLYCVDFASDGVDNMSLARLAEPTCPITPITFTKDDLVAVLPEVAFYLDTPATWTAVCQWYMNRQVALDGNKIVISGEGADELFGGYTRYRILYWIEQALEDAHLTSYQPLTDRVLGQNDEVLARMLNRGGPSTLEHARVLVETYGGTGSLIERMARTDFYTTMQVLLRMADRTAAAFSLENRSPFFDYRVMEFAARLPTRFKVDEHESKVILRRVAERLGVHPKIVNEKTKKGLYVPVNWGQGGPQWDRWWFSKMMQEAWRENCCRGAL